jgi:hypothetical protein
MTIIRNLGLSQWRALAANPDERVAPIPLIPRSDDRDSKGVACGGSI